MPDDVAADATDVLGSELQKVPNCVLILIISKVLRELQKFEDNVTEEIQTT